MPKVLATLLSLAILLAAPVCYAIYDRPIYLLAEYSIASPDYPEWMYGQALLMKKSEIMHSRKVGDVISGVTSAVDGLGATARTSVPQGVRIDRANVMLGKFGNSIKDARIGDSDVTCFAIRVRSKWLLGYLIRNGMQARKGDSGFEGVDMDSHESLRAACLSRNAIRQ